jgi:hypothetical protein
MVALLWILVLVWFVGTIVNTRLYYGRRHGVKISPHARGSLTAAYTSMLWPVLLFSESYRNPQMCSHSQHVQLRGDVRRSEAYSHLLREDRR